MSQQVKELGLDDYVGLAAKRWRWIVGAVIIGTTLVAAFTLTRDEEFLSRADILVLTEESQGQFSFDPVVEERLIRSPLAELQLMLAQRYYRSATEAIGYVPELEFTILAGANPKEPTESSVLRVISRESSPERAQQSAQVFVDTYVALRNGEDLADVTQGRQLALDLLDDVEERRNALRQPILDLQRERRQSDDPVRIQELNDEIDRLDASTNGAISTLNNQIGAVNTDLVGLEQAINSLDAGSAATRVINDAYLPLDPVSPDVPRNLILGFIVSVLLGLLLATLRELLDSGASDPSELASMADTPIIAAVPPLRKDRSAPGGVLPFSLLPEDQASSYRVLLDSMWLSGNGICSVAVTAARPGLGSTQTAVNMAQAEARRGVAVCLVDADFSHPSVLQRLGVESDGPGLADLLHDRCVLDDAITPTDVSKLDVVGAGFVDRATLDQLRSRRFGDLLEELQKRYELIVVDTSSVSALVDSRTVASQCDGVIVVYDHTLARRDVVTAVEVLRAAHARPVGLVSNRSNTRQQIHLVDAST